MNFFNEFRPFFKYPLFGKDSSPQYTAPRLSLIVTAVFWLIFFICGIFIKPSVKQKFDTVQIVLDTIPLEKPVEKEVADKSSTEVAKTTSEPIPAEKTPKAETPVPSENKKNQDIPTPTATQKKAETSKKTETYTKAPAYEIKKSVEELMEEQAASKQNKSASVDPWAQFEDDISETQISTKSVQKRIDNSSALSGNAGTAASTKNSSASTTTNNTKTDSSSASSSTTSALGKIASTAYSSKSFDGTAESVALVKSSKSSSGKVTVAMDDGSTRALLYPSKPVINISDENAKLIESTKTVKISFKVMAAGNIPRSSVSITPSDLLPVEIQNEIIDQISDWRFETSDNLSSAEFEFTIVKK